MQKLKVWFDLNIWQKLCPIVQKSVLLKVIKQG